MKKFPLLLVFGREYNGTGSVKPEVGTYDLTKLRGSTFWNRAYSLIARACPEEADFKQSCIRLNSSPLVFANVLPLPIENRVKAKHAIRASIPKCHIVKHLRQVFDLPIIKRVQVILLSVGPAPEFASARDLMESHCPRNVCLVNLPYLASRSSNQKVDKDLSGGLSAIRGVISNFFKSTNEG